MLQIKKCVFLKFRYGFGLGNGLKEVIGLNLCGPGVQPCGLGNFVLLTTLLSSRV